MKSTALTEATWKARGRCGDVFGEPDEKIGHLPRFDSAAGKWYFTALSLATDARAPAFERGERYYTCPVASLASPEVGAALTWYKQREKGILAAVWQKPLTARALDLIECVDRAVADLIEFESENRRNPANSGRIHRT